MKKYGKYSLLLALMLLINSFSPLVNVLAEETTPVETIESVEIPEPTPESDETNEAGEGTEGADDYEGTKEEGEGETDLESELESEEELQMPEFDETENNSRKPQIVSVDLEQTVYYPGDTVRLTVVLDSVESENFYAIAHFGSQSDDLELEKDTVVVLDNGQLEVTLSAIITDDIDLSTYYLMTLFVGNSSGNYNFNGNIEDSDITSQYDEYLKGLGFEVVDYIEDSNQETESSNQIPRIISASLEKKEYKADDFVYASVIIETADASGIDMRFDYSLQNAFPDQGSLRKYQTIKLDNDLYQIDFIGKLPRMSISTDYYLDSFTIIDKGYYVFSSDNDSFYNNNANHSEVYLYYPEIFSDMSFKLIGNTTDIKAPHIVSITHDKAVYNPGEEVLVTLEVEEESELRFLSLSYSSELNYGHQNVGTDLTQIKDSYRLDNGNQSVTLSFTLPQKINTANFNLSNISIFDEVGNGYHSSNPSEKNLENIYFSVESTEIDNTPPRILDIKIKDEKESYVIGSGDIIEIIVTVEEESKIDESRLILVSDLNLFSDLVFYIDFTDEIDKGDGTKDLIYTYTADGSKLEEDQERLILHLFVTDEYGNHTSYPHGEHSPVYDKLRDFSLNFVTNEIFENNSPIIKEIYFDKDTYYSGEDFTITFVVEEDTGIRLAHVIPPSRGGPTVDLIQIHNVGKDEYITKESENEYHISFVNTVPDFRVPINDYTFSMHIQDVFGNMAIFAEYLKLPEITFLPKGYEEERPDDNDSTEEESENSDEESGESNSDGDETSDIGGDDSNESDEKSSEDSNGSENDETIVEDETSNTDDKSDKSDENNSSNSNETNSTESDETNQSGNNKPDETKPGNEKPGNQDHNNSTESGGASKEETTNTDKQTDDKSNLTDVSREGASQGEQEPNINSTSSQAELPPTGETVNSIFIIVASILLLAGVVIIFTTYRNSQTKNK